MDTKGIISEHSKIKLELYKLYLERYLAVLLVTPFFERIHVHDIFAGSGVSKNDEKGSALLAAEVIKNIGSSQNRYGKTILLSLNDANKTNFQRLQDYVKAYSFASITNHAADQYIKAWSPVAGSHNLFFIDPHGYSQVSIENLKKLFSGDNRDFLIFMPVYHIYRFLRREEEAEQLKPIAHFLEDFGIKDTDAVKAADSDEFSDLIVEAFKKVSGTPFVYKQMIDNAACNSQYGLFFISRNVLGGEKFLDAQEKLKEILDDSKAQRSFSFAKEQNKGSILGALTKDATYDNVQLYELGIRIGLLPKHVAEQVKKLEKSGEVKIEEVPGRKRNRGGLYIGYKYFKNAERIIFVRLSPSGLRAS